MNSTELTTLIRKMIKEEISEQARLNEFKEDLMKQCIVLMGLPAAGKTTFINTEIKKYIPGFSGYTITNSDIQVRAAQYRYGLDQYNWLIKNIKSEDDLKTFIEDSDYMNNDGATVKMPITYTWWDENKDGGIKKFFTTFYKSYYASYFDIRDMAKEKTSNLFDMKIIKSGNVLIIDTVASNPTKIFGMLKKTKADDFHNTIIYLEIPTHLAMQRDDWRKEHQGRGVGESVIDSYAKDMGSAFNQYKKDGEDSDGVVGRLLHFIWHQNGNSPIKGTWQLLKDYKYFLKRKHKK